MFRLWLYSLIYLTLKTWLPRANAIEIVAKLALPCQRKNDFPETKAAKRHINFGHLSFKYLL
jgi:hypothetical protein